MQVGKARNDNSVSVCAAVAGRARRKTVEVATRPLRPTAFMEEVLTVESEYSVAGLKVGAAEGAPSVVASAAHEGMAWYMCTPSVLLMSPFTPPSCLQMPGNFRKVGHIWMRLPMRRQLEFRGSVESGNVTAGVAEQRSVRPEPVESLNGPNAVKAPVDLGKHLRIRERHQAVRNGTVQ